jgi:hypothetical protein
LRQGSVLDGRVAGVMADREVRILDG